jgi:hypothetical protein
MEQTMSEKRELTATTGCPLEPFSNKMNILAG